MRIRISEKTMELILLVLIVVTATCAYKFGYLKYSEMAEEVEVKNRALTEQITDQTERIQNRPALERAASLAETVVKEIMTSYSGGMTIEKGLVLTDLFETKTDIDIQSFGYTSSNVHFASTLRNDFGVSVENVMRTGLTYNFRIGYNGLKDFIKYIKQFYEKMSVDNFTLTYNDEYDELTGSMTLSVYTAVDADHAYEAPVVDGIKLGKDNIFD